MEPSVEQSNSSSAAAGPLRVAILGAGPAGLVLASALGKRGSELFEVDVFEQAASHTEAPEYNPNRSYTIDVTGHGAKAVRYLGPEAKAAFDEGLLAFRGVNVICIEDKVLESEGSGGWTGSRGTICQTLQQTVENKPNVRFHWHSRAEVVDFARGELQVTTTKVGADAASEGSSGDLSAADEVRRQSFDVIVAADGAGSRARSAMFASLGEKPSDDGDAASHGIQRFDNDNLSIMLAFDRKEFVSELDPSVLYLMQLRPVACVAGAINGPGGKDDPLWFCQVACKGDAAAEELRKMTIPELRKFIGPRTTRFCSDSELLNFQSRQPQSVGKGKVCSTWVHGRCVLLGDAAAPFPPVGQGVNAAMEAATVLDVALAECTGPDAASVSAALAAFESRWRPEADAMTVIARESDIMGVSVPQLAMQYILNLVGAQALTNSKKGDLPYSHALAREKIASRALVTAIAVGVVALGVAGATFFWRARRGGNSSKSSPSQ